MRARLLMSLIVGFGGWLGFEASAAACGGCFAPPGTFTAVNSHRMVITLGLTETVLWDQFIYSGAPEEFAWVLPIPSPDAVVEISDAAFVDAVDQETSPRVSPPSPSPCADAAGAGCGFGGGELVGPWPVDGVEVHQRGVVGPYETVILGSEDPAALYTWLGANGYAFPESGRAALDYYTAQGSSFVILRLRPGVGVSAMKPVRVRFRGFMGRFPLQMVTLGATGMLELSLWVVADQRYAPSNYANAVVDEADLIWDWQTSTSNYEEVFDATIQAAGGRAWITEYAEPLAGGELEARLRQDAAQEHGLLAATTHYPFVTRLRTRMLVDYLTDDLQLAPAADASPRPRDLVAGQSINGDCPTESAAGFASIGGGGAQAAILVAAVWLLGFARRRSRVSLTRSRLPCPGSGGHRTCARTRG